MRSTSPIPTAYIVSNHQWLLPRCCCSNELHLLINRQSAQIFLLLSSWTLSYPRGSPHQQNVWLFPWHELIFLWNAQASHKTRKVAKEQYVAKIRRSLCSIYHALLGTGDTQKFEWYRWTVEHQQQWLKTIVCLRLALRITRIMLSTAATFLCRNTTRTVQEVSFLEIQNGHGLIRWLFLM